MEFANYLKEYEMYWKEETPIPGLDKSTSLSRKKLLECIRSGRNGKPSTLTRVFETLPHTPSQVTENTPTVKVLQWNILAQGLSLGKDNFVLCPKEVLEWDHRRLLMLEEILNADVDILCLEEVDHFWFLKDVLGSAGYEGIFLPKPDSPALYVADSNGPDGCALLYDKSKFTLIKQDLVNLKTLEKTMTNQVCLLAVLCPVNNPDKKFCIGVVHLKAKTGWDELRYSQGAYLLQYLEQNYSDLPIIICGDFNADFKEPVYTAFTKSSLNLQSVYCLLGENGAEPPYTTWKIRGTSSGQKTESCRTIDYIWTTRDKLLPKSLYSIPKPEEIGENRLPSPRYASDHFALGAELYLL